MGWANYITSNGYSAWYDSPKNRIVIQLPQTMETLTNTLEEPQCRKVDLSTSDLTLLLQMAKFICKPEEKRDG